MFLFHLVLTMLTCPMRITVGELGLCVMPVAHRVRSKISLLSTDHAD